MKSFAFSFGLATYLSPTPRKGKQNVSVSPFYVQAVPLYTLVADFSFQ